MRRPVSSFKLYPSTFNILCITFYLWIKNSFLTLHLSECGWSVFWCCWPHWISRLGCSEVTATPVPGARWVDTRLDNIYTYLLIYLSTGQTGLKLQVKGESQGGQTAAGRGGQQLGAAAAVGQLRRVRGRGARRGRGLRHGRQHLRGPVPAAAARVQTHPETR